MQDLKMEVREKMLNEKNDRSRQTQDFSGLPWAPIPESFFTPDVKLLHDTWETGYVPNETRQLFVRSNFRPHADGGSPVAFSETNEAHPEGSVMVAGLAPQKIALTQAAVEALILGRIVETTPGAYDVFQSRQHEKILADIDARKEIYRDRYIQFLGGDEDFEDKWWPRIRARLIENPQPENDFPALRGRGLRPVFGL